MSRLLGTLIVLLIAILPVGCSEGRPLPILGERVTDPETGRLTDYRAPSFTLTTQTNEKLSSDDLKGKVHIVDFFFTSCPTICPTMTENMLAVQKAFPTEDRLVILSHTIDPKRDTPEKLRNYARQYGINTSQWFFLTGDRDEIFDLSRGYKVQAYGGDDYGNDIFHDGTFVLLDGQRRVRGYYNGLDEKDVRRLINDLKTILP